MLEVNYLNPDFFDDKIYDTEKFRQYAVEYWEKEKLKKSD